MTKKNENILQSVDNALTILDLLARQEEMGISDVTKAMHCGKSTAFRLLSTLEKHGLVYKTANARYRLGMKMAMFGELVSQRVEIVQVVHPHLLEMTRQVNETSHLVIWNNELNIIVADRVMGRSAITGVTGIGFSTYAHVTPSGKALLAFSDESVLDNYLKEVRREKIQPPVYNSSSQVHPFNARDEKALRQEIAQIRSTRIACDNGSNVTGLTCYATPILSVTGRAIASISISGASVVIERQKETIQKLLLQTAEMIEQEIF